MTRKPDQTRAAALDTLGDRLFASLTAENRRAVIVQIEACNTLRAALEGDALAAADTGVALIVIDATLETGDAALCRALGAASAIGAGVSGDVAFYLVPSLSKPGAWHEVDLNTRNGDSDCVCPATGMCWHRRAAIATHRARAAAGLVQPLPEPAPVGNAVRESKPLRQAPAIRPEFAEQCRRPADVDYTAMFQE